MRHTFTSGRMSGRRLPDRHAVRGLSLALLLVLLAPTIASADKSEQLAFGVDMAKRGLWSEALFRFRRANLEDPDNPRILNNLAVAHEAVGLFDEALDLYKRAVELDPANAELKRNYARFVEFYQGFRPREEDEKPPAGEQAGESDEGESGGEGGEGDSA